MNYNKCKEPWVQFLPKCQRCKDRAWYLKPSMLNKQMCCKVCIKTEKRLRVYQPMMDEVVAELFKGSNNFPELNIF